MSATKTRTQRGGPVGKDGGAVVISQAELARMRGLAKLDEDPAEKARSAKIAATQRTLAAAQVRKERILNKDKERTSTREPSDIELIHKMEHDKLVTSAQEAKDDDLDEAKYMDSLMQYARTVSIRDRQKQEKKEVKTKEKDEESAWARLMEADRVKAIQEREAAEKAKAVERRAGARVVIGQIAERRLEKERERDDVQREGELLLKEMERRREEEVEAQKKKAEKNRELQAQIVKENQRFLETKARQVELDRLEDLKVVEYLKEKAKREAEHDAEVEKKKKERELETARLRAMQEKMIDEQSIKDELQAKRAFEASERAWRKKTQEEAEKRARAEQETKEARDLQVMAKRLLLEEAAEREREEFERILATQKESEAKERTFSLTKTRAAHASRDGMKEQIEERRNAARAARDAALKEGEATRIAEAERKERLERLKQKKIAELRAEGVPEKYIVDLGKVKV